MFIRKMFFEIEKNGFYGTYYANPNGADCAMIGLLEMTQTIIWQNAAQNGYTKMVSMCFACLRENTTTAM